jgi:CheY-like chemotaxis protein
MIFLTSNLGAGEMMKEIQPGFGFRPAASNPGELAGRIERIGMHAIRKRFAPEFVNRIDRVIPYQPLGVRDLEEILDLQLQALEAHVRRRLGQKSFHLEVSPEGRRFLLEKGSSAESGARELNRTIHRNLLQPLASLVVRGEAPAGSHLVAHPAPGGERLEIRMLTEPKAPVLVIAEGNPALARLLDLHLGKAGFAIHWAGSEAEAMENLRQRRLCAVIIDQRAGQAAPWELGLRLREADPALPIVLLPASPPEEEQEAWCADNGFAVVAKPFLTCDLASELRRVLGSAEARQAPMRMAS